MSTPQVRAGVLSAGAWSQSSHLPALAAHDDVELVTVTRPDVERAAALAKQFGAAQYHDDWRAALDLGLDAVVVSSPPVAHVEQVVAALRSGAHVLVEKPFALHAADARTMLAASRETGRHLLVGFGWVSSPIFRRTKELIDAGELGRLEHVTMHLAVNTRPLLEGSTDGGWGGGGGSESSTYTDVTISAGGSAAVSMSHELGLLFWLTGRRPSSITAQTYPRATRSDLHDATLMTLTGGANAAVSCASTHPDSERPQWTMFLHGDGGQILIDSMADRLRLVRRDGSTEEPEPVAGFGAYDAGAPTAALIDVARGGPVPEGMSAALATDVVAVTDALYRSAETGRPVELGEWGTA